MIPISKSDKQYELVPEGSHVGRLYSIVEIGHVPNTYPGKEGTMSHKVRLTFELPEEKMVDGRPFVIGGKYTISLGDKSNLLPLVEGIVGTMTDDDKEQFDFKSLLEKTCLVSVVHRVSNTGKKYAQIASTAKLPKSMKAPEQINPSVYLDYHGGWDETIYSLLPQFYKDDMATSSEMQEKKINPEEITFE